MQYLRSIRSSLFKPFSFTNKSVKGKSVSPFSNVDKIKEEVQTYGFSCRYKDTPTIEGLNSYTLSYYIIVYSYDQKSHSNPKYIEVCGNQPYWTILLNFQMEPEKDTPWQIIEDWKCSSFFSPCYNIATVDVTIYFPSTPKLPSSSFTTLTSEGEVDYWKIDNNLLYRNEKVIGNVDEWEKYKDMLVIRQSFKTT
jgi:hypothetical protein